MLFFFIYVVVLSFFRSPFSLLCCSFVLYFCRFLYFFLYVFVSLFVRLFVCLFVCLFVYVFVYLCVCVCFRQPSASRVVAVAAFVASTAAAPPHRHHHRCSHRSRHRGRCRHRRRRRRRNSRRRAATDAASPPSHAATHHTPMPPPYAHTPADPTPTYITRCWLFHFLLFSVALNSSSSFKSPTTGTIPQASDRTAKHQFGGKEKEGWPNHHTKPVTPCAQHDIAPRWGNGRRRWTPSTSCKDDAWVRRLRTQLGRKNYPEEDEFCDFYFLVSC